MIVNIIGRGTGWEDGYLAEGEHWPINYWNPKADILFEIHPEGHPFHEKLKRERDNAMNAGIVLIGHELCSICADIFKTDYFGSSTDYLIAAAISERASEIHLWGVTMDDKGDHFEKRCCTDFWCGVAHGRGIKVVVHGNSTVMTTADGLTYGTFKPMFRRYDHV